VTFTRAVEEDSMMKDALAGNVLFFLKTPDSTGFTQENDVYLYPTFLVLNSDGEALHTWIGWKDPQEWVEHFDMATREPLTVDERMARFSSNPTFADAYMLGTIWYARRQTREGHDYYRRAMDLDEAAARRKGVPALLFKTAYRGLGNGDFTIEQCTAVAEEIMSDEQVRTEDALEITERLARVVNDIGEETVIPLFRLAHIIVEKDNSDELYIRRQRFYGNYAMIVEKDPARAVGYKRETMPEGWKDNAGHLNSFAWWCFENNVNLEEAEELSRRSVELAEPGRTKANCMDTLAEIVNLRGDTEQAALLIRDALAIDPDNEYLKNQLVRFEEALTQSI
jgi:tetratricopeptide (TPR) repeat protein